MTTQTDPLSIAQDRRLIRPRWHSKRFVVARVTAPVSRRDGGRPPVNLAFVLDRSGSMGGQKIRLAAQAVEEGIGRLQGRRPVQRRHLRRPGRGARRGQPRHG